MDDQTRIELEAAAFRRVARAPDGKAHRRAEHRPDEPRRLLPELPQRWYQEAANERGIDLGKEEAREIFYGMPYDHWKAEFQTDASPDKQEAFKTRSPRMWAKRADPRRLIHLKPASRGVCLPVQTRERQHACHDIRRPGQSAAAARHPVT